MSEACPDNQIMRQLERAIRHARLVLYWENLWPRLWLPIGVAGVFVLLSWLGLWTLLPATGRMAGVLLFALSFVILTVPAIIIRYPTRRLALRMLDEMVATPETPDPASILSDIQAAGREDPVSRVLWGVHRCRAEAALKKLKIRLPQPATAQYDYYGLRGALIVALVGAAFIAGNERSWRVALAFDWRNTESFVQTATRVDGWIDPPAYTRLPPVMIDWAKEKLREVSAPVGSTLVLRFTGQRSAYWENSIETSGGLAAQPNAQLNNDEIIEHHYKVTGTAEIAVQTSAGISRLTINAIPDHPPVISFSRKPEATRRGGLVISFTVGDDYGVAKAQALMSPLEESVVEALVPPPVIDLPLPSNGEKQQTLRTTVDLADSPWAGMPVELTLLARDEVGQEGRSEKLKVLLPQRLFHNPLAKSLIEQRHVLAFRPHDWSKVLLALNALQLKPDLFEAQSAAYLGLVTAEKMLKRARKEGDYIDVVNYLWEMAVLIEDGNASDTERVLKVAQQALQEAINRGAPEQEITHLANKFREALNQHLLEMQRNQARNHSREDKSTHVQGRSIKSEELAKMIERLEKMAREGNLAGAQHIMDQLQDLLENLQIAQSSFSSNPQASEAGRALKTIDGMIRNQQRLRDDTYQHNNRQMQGEFVQEKQKVQQMLRERQKALRQTLDQLRSGLTMQEGAGEPGFRAAVRAMHEAEQRLAQDDTESAIEAQGRALEALLYAAQDLTRQMRQNQQGEDGGYAGEDAHDPLGRSMGERWSDGDTRVPGKDEPVFVRARRILEELRRRLGNPDRAVEERDYLERLLQH